jgi:hypothetical protein
MRRPVALALLITLVSSAGMLSPAYDDKEKPGQRGGGITFEKGTTPSVAIPGPGDVVGGTVTLKGSRGSCESVVLVITPPPPAMPYTVNATINSDGRTWSYTLSGITADFKVSACCKKAPDPGPCSDATVAVYQATPPVTGDKPTDGGRPKYYSHRVDLHGTYQHKEGAVQSVYVVLENFEASDEKLHRSHAAKAELRNGKWSTCFTNVGKGLYVVRVFLVSRTDPVKSTSYDITVE